MKKNTFLIILICIIFLSCQTPEKENNSTQVEQKTKSLIHSIPEGDLKLLIIEGCEYFVYKESESPNHAYGYMAHKGNCKNSIHCYNSIPMDSIALDSLTTNLKE